MVKVNNVNIDSKSQLAKLFATENISVEHNNVKTASFDLENRIVTLPIFKKPSGDVYDMLTAHECSHALHTPIKAWSKLEDPKYRAYVNVIEDTRIDKLIQKKYPGIVKNYVNAFDILMKQNFFGLKGKNVNTDLMLIDKINMYYKSSKKLNFKFSKEEQSWIDRIDNIKTFNDVLKISKELYGWQEKQLQDLTKLPDFDNHPLAKNYKLDKNGKDTITVTVQTESNSNKDSSKSQDNENKSTSTVGNPNGFGGDNVAVNQSLTCITDQNFETAKDQLLDKTKTYRYATLPEPIFKNALISNEQFLKDMKANNSYYFKQKDEQRNIQYIQFFNWIKQDFLRFKKENLKTVMYLVKEFEMKKAATAYKRATTDKTGVIDPLKLKNYKFSDDIFKRLTILPNSKNHGMIILVDWSGSMCDIITKTVHQLCNLVWFCQKINIPFEVYLFKDLSDKNKDKIETFNKKNGDMFPNKAILVNVASHRLKKTVLHESLQYLYQMGYYFNRTNYYNGNEKTYSGYVIPISHEYHLSSTPLNEALIMCNKLVPLFQSKYKVEKLSFITLTDGEANSEMADFTVDNCKPENKHMHGYGTQTIIKDGKKRYTTEFSRLNRIVNSRASLTSSLLKMIRNKYNATTIGFYLSERTNKNSFERFVSSSIYKKGIYQGQNTNFEKLRKQFLKDKVIEISQPGYDSYYVVNAKDMNIENYTLGNVAANESTSNIKKMFSKSMRNRIYSRVLLNKFIEKIA
jgi:hypothetical protein